MTAADLLPLLPILILGADAILVLLLIALRRALLPVCLATVGGGLAGFAGLLAWSGTARVTTLIVVDDPARFFVALLLLTLAVLAVLSYRYLRAMPGHREEYYLLLILATLGAVVLSSSAHFASLFLGLEILSVSLYGLVAYPADRAEATEGGVKYLFSASLGSAVLLFGMALVYADRGTMSIEASDLTAAAPGGLLSVVGVSMIFVGLAVKLALVPFHMWVADVYQGAPAPATAAIATVSKVSVLAVVYRLLVGMKALELAAVAPVLTGIAIASMLIGSWLSLLQKDVKRLLAYSSVAQVGYLLLPLFAFTELGKTALYYGIAAYLLASVGAFGIVTVLSTPSREADRYEDYRGLAASRPWLAAILILLLLSLAGIPPTMGFTGKLYLVLAATGSGRWLLAATLLASSAIGLFYYLRLVLVFFETGAAPVSATPPAPLVRVSGLEGAVFLALSLLLIALGVFPAPFLRLIQLLVPS